MPVIVVANPKGGVGKTTLSTNLAGYLASRGRAVMLGDTDRQQSARTWLGLRPAGLPKIDTWAIAHGEVVKPPKGTTHVVLDTPAGLHGKRLDEVMKLADEVLIPLQPGIFDIHATNEFVDQLRHFLEGVRIPLIAFLRDTQNYVHLAAHGLTLWDVASTRFQGDREQWAPIMTFVN